MPKHATYDVKTKFTDLLLDAQLDRDVIDKTASLLAGVWPFFCDNQQFTGRGGPSFAKH